MNKEGNFGKAIIAAAAIVSLAFVASFALWLWFATEREKVRINDSNAEIEIIDKYNHCLSIVLDKSKENGRPCSAQEAESVCAKFNQSGSIKIKHHGGADGKVVNENQ